MAVRLALVLAALCTLQALGSCFGEEKSMGNAPENTALSAKYELLDNEKKIKVTVTGKAAFWVALGFQNDVAKKMKGMDVFMCSEGKVRRTKDVASNSDPWGDGEETSDICTQTGDKTVMEFTRPIEASDGVTIDFKKTKVAWAWGDDGDKKIAYHMGNRGFTAFSGEVELAPVSGLVWGHAILMLLSWGFMLPLGVVAARTLRMSEGKIGGKPTWFALHQNFQYMGWTLQLVGFILIVVEFQMNGQAHFTHPHFIIGFVVWLLGTLQPLNAFFRPHGHQDIDKSRGCADKRTKWEYLHKGSGYTAVWFGVLNCAFGLVIVWDNKKEPLNLVATIIFAVLFLPVLVFFLWKEFTLRGKQRDPRPVVG